MLLLLTNKADPNTVSICVYVINNDVVAERIDIVRKTLLIIELCHISHVFCIKHSDIIT